MSEDARLEARECCWSASFHAGGEPVACPSIIPRMGCLVHACAMLRQAARATSSALEMSVRSQIGGFSDPPCNKKRTVSPVRVVGKGSPSNKTLVQATKTKRGANKTRRPGQHNGQDTYGAAGTQTEPTGTAGAVRLRGFRIQRKPRA